MNRNSSRIRRIDEDRLLPGRVSSGAECGAVSPVIVQRSEAMSSLVAVADRVAKLESTILITGESGVGKDVLARYIHFRSDRASAKMIVVNCGALTETLFESEFFGCARGAYTGAHVARAGLLEAADGSTLFLDEVGDISPAMQVKLLRFLEDGVFRRIGETADRKVNVRIIAATNKDLEAAVREGTFRVDLYYRLNVIVMAVPPLRERREEIPELIESFLSIYRSRFRRPNLRLSHEARRRLQSYNWPGNVRELRNCLERACALAAEEEITEEVFFGLAGSCREINTAAQVPALAGSSKLFMVVGESVASKITLEALERQHILEVLDSSGGNRDRAAKVLGISARTLYRKLREYGTADRIERVKEVA